MGSGETIHATIARNVREQRQARGLTLDALATTAGISRRMLIMIENGETNPSVGVLDRLGGALGVGLPGLIGLPSRIGPGQVIPVEASPIFWQGADPASVARLAVATAGAGDVELWDWRLAGGEVFTATTETPGAQKLALALEGTLMVALQDTALRVPAGAAARFLADQPHSYENREDAPIHFVIAMVFRGA